MEDPQYMSKQEKENALKNFNDAKPKYDPKMHTKGGLLIFGIGGAKLPKDFDFEKLFKIHRIKVKNNKL